MNAFLRILHVIKELYHHYIILFVSPSFMAGMVDFGTTDIK